MVGIESAGKRAFGQTKYDISLLRPTLEGEHYKFTILLPVSEFFIGKKDVSKTVFTDDDVGALRDLIRKDFDGITYSFGAKSPSTQGDWIDRKGKIVVNEHVLFEVYTQKTEKAVAYFTELKARLLIHAKEVRKMEQEDIVIEQREVTFIPSRTLEALGKGPEPKERLKYLKR